MEREINKLYATIGQRIAKERKRQGLSQEQLASGSGLARAHMGFVEIGRRKPTLTTLYKICKVLGIKLEDLLKGL